MKYKVQSVQCKVVVIKFLSFALCVLTFSLFLTPVYALEDIGSSRISPASPLYFLKTIRESIELKLAATPRVKIIRELEFATRRLREVKSLIPTESQDLIEPTLERYWYHLQAVDNLKDLELSTRVKEVLGIHLETLQSIYPAILNKRAKMAIRAAINRIVQRADITNSAKLPACTFLAEEASSSALNEVEKEVLLNRAQSCFNSLKQQNLKLF